MRIQREVPDACVYVGEALTRYGFGHGHPFGSDRLSAFWEEARGRGLDRRVGVCAPVTAGRETIERFHSPAYVERVLRQSETGEGYLDYGDTPAFRGVYEAAAAVVGSTVDAVGRVMAGRCRRAFVPIAGLHHARRERAGGFCVFNDCAVAIEVLRAEHGVTRVAYVDIDAHHGDGVFYAFEDDPDLVAADLHEDGRFLYPGTGRADETGAGAARGAKLNIPMLPGAGDEAFLEAWGKAEAHLDKAAPEFFLLQCGADGLAGDPIAHLEYTPAVHAHAARRVRALAERHAGGRLVAMGGGGYDRRNLAQAWCAVVAELA
ncbi:MAG: acetoin utilization protein AcuC [Elusimicrobiota bacterium]